MPDLFKFIKSWWKQVLGLVTLCIIIAVLISLMMPKQYLAVATAVPASSFASDKSRIFNENIQALYTALGNADDLDMILGTAELDTVYYAVTHKSDLIAHYHINETGDAARAKAAATLKAHTRVLKSGYGELKVKVWDKEPAQAAILANQVMSTLDDIHRELQSAGNAATLEALRNSKKSIADTSGNPTRYDQLISQYEVLVNSKPHVLVTVESARPSFSPNKPNLKRNVILAAGLGLLFGICLALLLDQSVKKPAA